MDCSDLLEKVNKLKGKREEKLRSLKSARSNHITSSRAVKMSKEADAIIHLLAEDTYCNLRSRVTGISTAALYATLGEDYEFDLEFGKVGRRITATPQFLRGADKVPTDPIDDDSGGAAYIAAFGLRCAAQALQRPRTRCTIFLDEPALHINDPTRRMQEKFAEMIKKISGTGVQFIIVTAVPEIEDVSDKVFRF